MAAAPNTPANISWKIAAGYVIAPVVILVLAVVIAVLTLAARGVVKFAPRIVTPAAAVASSNEIVNVYDVGSDAPASFL